MATIVDFYALLGVPHDSGFREIQAAYRRLARRHHPDAGGDGRYMIALNKAWAILGDPDRRADYDQKRLDAVIRRSAPVEPKPDPVQRTRPTPVIEPVGRRSGTVLDFGRYVGWSIGQLASYDPEYLQWLERTPIGRPLQPEIRAILGMRPKAG